MIGDTIGPYKLLDRLGEGGFGSVWLAERRTAIVQRVALKLIKPGMDTKGVVARFEQERQALALMDHPAVAKVFDAGATAQGRPYFAMEYVAGAPIALYCDGRAVGVAEKLELFAQACEGVHHAHEHGILHRDLKPSNILVTEHDGRPQAKVIDFGIAKALAGPLTDKTLVTREGNALGTPLYMSPEQSEGEVSRLSGASDIYSLGVTLFELLTRRLPWDVPEGQENNAEFLRRLVQASEPALLTKRLPAHGPGAIESRALRSDLETIVLKAMHAEPLRRYATARELADDIRRAARGEGILAQRENPAYVARRRVQRVLSKNRPIALLTAWALGAVLSYLAATAVIRWTPIVPMVDGWVAAAGGASAAGATPARVFSLEHVRVLAMSGESAAALASSAGVTGISSDDRFAMRQVHGAVLKQLAQADPACVVVDISFNDASPGNDTALVEGLDALFERPSPVPIVLASRRWWHGAGLPPLTPAITGHQWARFGGITFTRDDATACTEIAVSRDGVVWLPHMAVGAYAAVRHPGAHWEVSLDTRKDAINLAYWKVSQGANASKSSAGPSEHILCDDVVTKDVPEPSRATEAGDQAAVVRTWPPDRAALEAVTWTYPKFLASSTQDRRAWAQGHVVVIGNPPEDKLKLPDGREVSGPHLMASAIEQLLSTRHVRVPNTPGSFLILLLGSLVGIALMACTRSWLTLAIAMAVTLVVVTAACIVLYASQIVVLSPVVVTVTIACGACAMLAVPGAWPKRAGIAKGDV